MFTPKEQREIEELEQAKHNPKLSKIEQQITEAKLQDIRASKGKPYLLGQMSTPTQICSDRLSLSTSRPQAPGCWGPRERKARNQHVPQRRGVRAL